MAVVFYSDLEVTATLTSCRQLGQRTLRVSHVSIQPR